MIVDTPSSLLAQARNVKALVNHRYPFRLRVGDYHVFFSVAPSGLVQIISIEEVRKRNERTH